MKKLKEILRYLSCSVVITVISWGSYIIFVDKMGLPVFLGNLLSWLLATLCSFFVNKFWVFQSFTMKKKEVLKEFTGFFSSRIFSGVIEILGVPLLEKAGFDNIFYPILTKLGITLEILFTDGLYSKIGIGIIVLIVNYITAKIFVFKGKKEEKTTTENN